MSLTIADEYYLPTGIDYDPILVMAAIAGATILINAVTEIANGTIVNDHISASTIVASEKIQAASIEADQIATNAITATKLNANSVTTDKLAADSITSVKISTGAITAGTIATGAVTTDKLAVDAVTADKINVESLESISAVLGTIVSGTITGATFRTSADPADSRVLIDSAGLRGYDSTLGLTFKIPTDGSAPLFSSGQIQSATIIDTTIISNDFKTSSELPWLEFSDSGVAYRETTSTGKYGSGVQYGDGTKYGVGVSAYYGNSSKPILSVESERVYADIHLYNRSSNPSGAATVGDLACVSGQVKFCYGAGTPGDYRTLLQSLIAEPIEIDTASDVAAPALVIDQDDIDEPFIDFDGDSAADASKNISTMNGDGAVEGPKNYSSSNGWAFEGMVRIAVAGTDYWMPYYSVDTA